MRNIVRASLLAAAIGGADASAEEPRQQVTIGVRVDARPFAWRDRANGSFRGFLVDLCTDAVARANYPFRQVPVTAAERIRVLNGERDDIDLLCDPTTITLGRLSTFAALEPPGRLSFSPIVFVANGAYLSRLELPRPDGEQPAPQSHLDCLPSGALPGDGEATTRVTAGYVVGTTIGPILRNALRNGLLELSPEQVVCTREFEQHPDAAAAFCKGDLDLYFGDADIVASSVLEAGRTLACADVPPPRPISYEPYALVVSGRTGGFREHFVRALYEVFNDGTAIDRFRGHFKERTMSSFLETLFRINQIPDGEITRSDDGQESEEPEEAPAPEIEGAN